MLEISSKHIVRIEGYNHEGYGVAHVDEFVVFVKEGIFGEIVEIVITKSNKNYAF